MIVGDRTKTELESNISHAMIWTGFRRSETERTFFSTFSMSLTILVNFKLVYIEREGASSQICILTTCGMRQKMSMKNN